MRACRVRVDCVRLCDSVCRVHDVAYYVLLISICAALKVAASDKKDAQSHGGIGATSFASMMMRIVVGRGKACTSVVNTSFMTGAAHDSSRNHLVVFAQAVVMS